MTERKVFNRREFLQFVGAGVVFTAADLILKACNFSPGDSKTSTPLAKETLTREPSKDPTKAPTATETATKAPTEVPTPQVKFEGGAYTPEQLELIEGEAIQKKVKDVQDWVDWWAKAAEPVISIDTLAKKETNLAVIFDTLEPNNADKAIVVMQSEETWPNNNITPPWKRNSLEFMGAVPETADRTPGHANVEGMGPLFMARSGTELSDGTQVDWVWMNVGGKPARVGVVNGKVLERINTSGEWERVLPDGFPQELIPFVGQLSKEKIPVSWNPGENEDQFLMETNDPTGKTVVVAKVDKKAKSFEITTEKNEPYTFDYSRILVQDGQVVVNDVDKKKLLYLGDGAWKSDKLLYLAAGENLRLYTPFSLYPDWPMAEDGKGLPTVLLGEQEPQDGFSTYQAKAVVLRIASFDVASNLGLLEVGFYDIHGFLHTYNVTFGGFRGNENQMYVAGCVPIENGQSCEIYTAKEAYDKLKAHYESGSAVPLIGLNIALEPLAYNKGGVADYVAANKETNEKIITAVRKGDGFPDVNSDFSLYSGFLRFKGNY
jgi:hypothetical protein